LADGGTQHPDGEEETIVEGREPSYSDEIALPAPHRIGRFTVLEEIGRGGMGIVYSAYDPTLDRRVAVKVLRADAAEGTGTAGRARLLREAQATARLSHPNVITVYEVGTLGDDVFVATEYIEGETLRRWIGTGDDRKEWPEILRAYIQAGRGLAAAHEAGLVHRDFKPENVLVDENGRARVLDFGLARAVGDAAGISGVVDVDDDESPTESRRRSSANLEVPITWDGAVMGTPSYMAPEQHSGGRVDARSDQFAFCIALYEALHGERPFQGPDVLSLRTNIVSGERAEVPARYPVPAWLDAVLDRGLRIKPVDRFESMEDLLGELSRDRSRRRRRVQLGLGLAFAGFGGALAYGTLFGRVTGGAGDPCADQSDKLDAVWGDVKSEEVRAAFEGTGLAHARETFDAIKPVLDDYTQHWDDTRRQVCEAASESEELFDVRQACLNRRLSELRAATAVLGRADDAVVQSAAHVIEQLRDPSTCATMDTLQIEMPLPKDEADATQVMELRHALDEVKALVDTGNQDEALTKAADVVSAARELDYQPLVAESLLQLGLVHAKSGRYGDAAVAFESAMWAAEVSRHDTAAVDIWNAWIRTVGYQLHDHEAAEEMIPRQDAALHRLGDDDRRWASGFKARAAVSFDRGEFDGAVENLERARELLDSDAINEPARLASVLQNLGTALYRAGRLEESEATLRRAVELLEAVPGPRHPALSAVHQSLGGLARMRDDPLRAVVHYRLALEIFTETHLPSHPGTTTCHRNLGDALAISDRLEDAVTHYRLALANEIARTGAPEPPHFTSFVLGRALLDLGRPAEALAHLEVRLSFAEDNVQAAAQVADARFAVARALTSAEPDNPTRRSRAIDLARHARRDYAADEQARDVALVDAWLERVESDDESQ